MRYEWVILNQSQSPATQRLLERLCDDLGPGLLCTGRPFPVAPGSSLAVTSGPAYDRSSLARRAASWAKFTAWGSALLARQRGRPFALVVSNPPMMPNATWLVKSRLRGYAVLVWDIYPEHMLRRGWIRQDGVVHRAWLRANRRALTDASAVVTISRGMGSALETQAKQSLGQSLHVIPNWADTAHIRPEPKASNAIRGELALDGKCVVLYSGNFGATHGLEVIPRAAALLHQRPDIHFVMAGRGLGRPQVEEDVRRLGLDNLTLIDRQPWARLATFLAAADIGIVAQEPATAGLSFPSKTYNLLAAGVVPLTIAPPSSDLEELGQALGASVQPDDPQALAQAVVNLAADKGRLRKLGLQARQAAETRFSEEAALSAWRSVLLHAMA